MATESAVVLLSGGLDSTCLAKWAVGAHDGNVIALSLLYGQKHNKEVDAATAVAKRLGIRHDIQSLPRIFEGAGSTLTDADRPNPVTTYEEIRTTMGVSPTYVPFRNANLLSAATTIALVHNAGFIYYAAHAEDSRNWAYPDCTPEFNGAMANAIYVGTYHKVRLVTPFQWMTKVQVVTAAAQLGAPLELSWSCYNGREKACGTCPTCVERINAFRSNNLIDPAEYEIQIDWEKCRPWGSEGGGGRKWR